MRARYPRCADDTSGVEFTWSGITGFVPTTDGPRQTDPDRLDFLEACKQWAFRMRLLILLTLCHGIVTSLGDKSALLIIDVQDCFLAGGSLAVKDGNEVISVINSIRTKYESSFSLVLFSQDWHCSDHVSFASQHTGKSPLEEVTLQYDENGKLCYGNTVPDSFPHAHNCSEVTYNVTQMLWPDHCVKTVTSGPTSSRIDPMVIRKSGDIVIPKGDNCEVDSYSMFYDNGGFRQTRLHNVLQDNNIDTVYVTGLALDYCVYYTSLDANRLGYKTFTVADASRGVDGTSTTAAVADLVINGVNVIQSSSLDTFLQVSSAPWSTVTSTLAVLMSTIIPYCLSR